MVLLTVFLLTVAAVALAAPAVRLCDRNAGWPLAAFYLVAFLLLAKHLPDTLHGTTLRWETPWIPHFATPIAENVSTPGAASASSAVMFTLQADMVSMFFALLALGIGAVVFIYSAAYLPKNSGNYSFYLMMTAFMASVVMLVTAGDVVVLFIGWELVSIASFLLIARSQGGWDGSMRTLILTFFGGLTLLSALGIAVTSVGSTDLDTILHSPIWAERPTLTACMAVLIALSGFTKAAQWPFHFWLPEAMAAATPVSAFLHAAAVVKAGIYLLVRFSTLFHSVAVWNWLLITVGMGTAIMSALFAVQKTDLKKLTAYSTVSHLGWIVATIGVGTGFAMAAALVHTLAHALFKSSLFMLIGVVDHQTGTRDVRRLGRIYRAMPFTFAGTVIGAASMAAVPPLFGFVSKEGMLTAFLDAPLGNLGVVLLLVFAGLAALLTFLYSTRLVFGAFVDGPREYPDLQEAPVALWLPAALPGFLSIPAVLVLSWMNEPLTVATSSLGLPTEVHLALWHGLTWPLLISVLVLAAGVALIAQRKKLWAALDGRHLWYLSGNELLHRLLAGLTKAGRALASMANSLNPARHLMWPFILLVLLGAVTIIAPGVDGMPLQPRVPGIDRATDLIPLAIIAVSVAGAVRTSSRLSALILVGTTGVGVSLMMLNLGAPDVAITQFMVEALTVVVMFMVFRHQSTTFSPVRRRIKLGAGTLAVATGVVSFLGIWGLLGRHERPELAMWYLEHGPEISGGRNVVSTIVVEFRAVDTLGELSVLAMSALVMGALVSSVPRSGFLAGTHPAPFGQSRLNALPLHLAARLASPILIAFGLIVFMRGEDNPGGGFVAAVIWATAVMLAYLSKGRDTTIFRHSTPTILTSLAIFTAILTALLGYTKGAFLEPLHAHWLGTQWSTALIFDGAIVFAMIAMVTQAINGLGAYVRPGVEKLSDLDYMQDDNSFLSHDLAMPADPDDDEEWPLPLEPADSTAAQAGTTQGATTKEDAQ